MKKDNNVRTMEYIQLDGFNRPMYKCIETGHLYKDTNLGEGTPDLHTCGNKIEGEPCCPIKSTLEIKFINQYKQNNFEYEYMLLGRLQEDCKTYISGNIGVKRLWGDTEKEHIDKMKKIYCMLPKKPIWLTMKQIKDYEKQMLKDV